MNTHTHTNVPLLELDLLRTFVAIAEAGNFSAAAEIVHRTPSAVSMQVKRMEELLGRPVFLRDSRSVTLTRDGTALLEHARRLLALNRDVMSRFRAPGVAGVVHLGAPDEAAERFLPAMLCRFSETHPEVTVNVRVDSSRVMSRMVATGDLDLAIVTCNDLDALEDGLEVLVCERLVWAGLCGGVAVEQRPIPLAVWDAGCAWHDQAIAAFKAQDRPYRVAFQSSHILGQRAAIKADLAIAPFPAGSLGGDIVEIAATHDLPGLPDYALGLLTAATDDPAVAAAADHLRASFARHPAAA